MIKSMTGYGMGEACNERWQATVEISSVNRKQFSCSVTLPRELFYAESQFCEAVRRVVSRGNIMGIVIVKKRQGASDIDVSLLSEHLAAFRNAAIDLGLEDDLKASHLLAFQNIATAPARGSSDPDLLPVVMEALQAALCGLSAMREKEGVALAADLTSRLEQLKALRESICRKAPEVPRRHAEAMKQRLGEWAIAPDGVEPASIAREIALFADRCDVSEELTRLASHFAQFGQLLNSNEACGRKLDFLCQEMMREINTTGSKANDILIASDVIEFKAMLETIREQVQNVE